MSTETPGWFYLSMECDKCEADMFMGPALSLITYRGLPVIPADFATQETFECDECGALHYTGDLDYEVEGGDAGNDEDEPAEESR